MVQPPLERYIAVLDTSVLLKWFRQGEVLADRALVLRDAYLEDRISVAVPSLVAYEVTNVLRYKNDMTTDQVQEAVESLFDMDLAWMAPNSGVLRRAVEIARACDTTVYDAAFAALAESLDASFITADETLARRLEAFPFVFPLGDVLP